MNSVLIGISCKEVRDTGYPPHVVGVRRPYVEAVVAAGGIPFLIPLVDLKTLRIIYDLVDGVLLSGGEDVHPRFYGESCLECLQEVSEERDIQEIQLVKWACYEQKPLLGICRGLQLMNVALGGSLYQDIFAQTKIETKHARSGSAEAWQEPAHAISIFENTKLRALLGGKQKAEVNSLHHQAIKGLANGLTVSARADDGIIEGIELSNHAFFVGVQGHPEVLVAQPDSMWLGLFKGFIEAVYAAKQNRIKSA